MVQHSSSENNEQCDRLTHMFICVGGWQKHAVCIDGSPGKSG